MTGKLKKHSDKEDRTSVRFDYNKVRLSAEGPSQSRQCPNGSWKIARPGTEKMDAMIRAMAEIKEAGHTINRIIKVIDEITFQANLLALASTADISRTGQREQALALMSEEVRSLIAKSAKAVEELAELIDRPIEKVSNGTRIAGKTSVTLAEIVGISSKFSALFAEVDVSRNVQ